MSYCRFGPDSDVYMYPRTDGSIVCSMCALPVFKNSTMVFEFPYQALQHLQTHLKHNHRVPRYAFNRLIFEIEEKDAET